MSLQTPLAKVLGLGSAKEGIHHWKAQKLTALALVPLGIWFVLKVICLAGAEHHEVVEALSEPWAATLMVVLLFSIFYHMQLGLQVVIEDYVHAPCVKITLLVLNQFAAIILGTASIISVVRIAAGV